MSIGEKLTLYIKVKIFQLREEWKSIRKAPLKLELSFLLYSFFSNPFRVSKKFCKKKGEALHTYGETSYSAFETISGMPALQSDDLFYDLGCGRGKLCFWTSLKVGCKVKGWDWNQKFISRAQFLKQGLQIKNLSFECSDFTKNDFSDASAIYLYGFFLTDAQIKDLEVRFSKLKQKTRVITISFPLSSKNFSLVETFLLSFPWGKTEAFLHLKK